MAEDSKFTGKATWDEQAETRIVRGVNGIEFEQNGHFFSKRKEYVKSMNQAQRSAANRAADSAKEAKDKRKAPRDVPPVGPTVPEAVVKAAKENAAAAEAETQAD